VIKKDKYMKLQEVIHMQGINKMMYPATNINQQVVQPTTKQVVDDSQTQYNKTATKTKAQEKINSKNFNNKEEDVLKNYFDGDINYADEKLNKIFMKLKKE
jgi:hypothetical protein